MESVMDKAQGFFGKDTLGRVSSWLHESPAGTKAAVQDALPVSLLGLANQASTDEGSRALLSRFQRGDYPHLEADELDRAVKDPETTDRLVQTNRGFTEGMFGGKLGPLVDGMAEHAGVSRSAVSKVLGLATPIVLGMIGKRAIAERLDAGGLRRMLGEQQQVASRRLPSSLSRLLVPAGAGAAAGHAVRREADVIRIGAEPRRRPFPWWLIGLLAAIAVVIFGWGRKSRHLREAQRAGMSARAPMPEITAGSVSALDAFLEGDAPTPQGFILRDLTFSKDSAEISPMSRPVLDDVASVLATHGNARVRVEGHTDPSGVPAANRQLSQARAEATKRYLISRGVDGSRIEAAGYGADRPIASNDTATGRAQNRRTELVVLSK
jgi:outer membrane protein OmpA-like peptidoglycan-associated protein